MTSTSNSNREQYSDAELAERYTDQPARLPDGVRAELSRALDGEPLLAYALVDLNEELELCERWVALSRHWLVTIGDQGSGGTRIVRNRLGLTLAGAGVDTSNTGPGSVVLLPLDPDASARAIR